MGKHAKYKKHYRKEWEKEKIFKDWLEENKDIFATIDNKEARCKICKINLRAQHADLVKHTNRIIHKQNMNRLNVHVQPTLKKYSVPAVTIEAKTADIKLTVYTAVHTAIRGIDHLTDLLHSLGKGSNLEKLRLHRTKCSKLISEVIAPALLADLISDVGDSSYSLIVDESTDVSVCKYLAFCIRYFSKKRQQIITDFLGCVSLAEASAENLYKATIEYLATIKLDVTNMIGLGTDNASTMIGCNHSLYKLLRDRHVPELQLISCMCHSLHLAASKASDELPSSLEFFIREINRWFSCSPLRKSLYNSLYASINKGAVNQQLVKLSKTRWLAWHGAVASILDQWLELKTHFNIMAMQKENKCYMARILRDMFEDDSNHLYLLFLRPILKEVVEVNLLFQKENPEVTKLFGDLRVLLLSLVTRILKPTFIRSAFNSNHLNIQNLELIKNYLSQDDCLLSFDSVDYGDNFKIKMQQCKVSEKALYVVKDRCMKFLRVLCIELANRLPPNVPVLEAVRYLHPKYCLRRVDQPAFNELPLVLTKSNANREVLEEQWRKLSFIDWPYEFGDTELSNSVHFWAQVKKFTNAGGDRPFNELATFALRILCLPFSNATVERVFSHMNAIKTKPHNRIGFNMLVALLRIRIRLIVVDKCCCKDFEISEEMLKLFTHTMYETVNRHDVSRSADDIENENAFQEGLTLFGDESDENY